MNKLITAITSALLVTGIAQADQQILDDLIVDGSACIGQDCVNGESFGFDTIRIKENNLRIRAVDTSTSASFPTNDWQITFNDSTNGGANKFSIEDIDGGKIPFTIEAGVPSNSIYVDSSGGKVGFGTSNPVVDLHVKKGNTPTLRLEQDGSSGFAAQTWDMAGNEANFFIRDASNGSTLPFRIFPGAPSNSLTITNSGNIGMGIQNPGAALHINRSGLVLPVIQSTSNDAVQLNLKSNSTNRRVIGIDTAGTVKSQVILEDDGVRFSGQTATTNISTVFVSDAVQLRFKSDSSSNRRLVAVNLTDTVMSQVIMGDDEIQLTGPSASSDKFATLNSTGLVLEGGSITVNGTQVHNFPDYVFDRNYELMPLNALKAFISKNKHLPEIPSANDAAENGINITELQLSLLKKVEELTLYAIAQQETIEDLQSNLFKLERKNRE